jgi:chemotaxis protein methyltransferase CheR
MAGPHPLLADPDYPAVKQFLIASTGLAFYDRRDADLAARIAARIAELGLEDCRAYLDLLTDYGAGETERHTVIAQLTIGETYFFRHKEQFDALRDIVFPDVIARNRDRRTLRIWSAGCATGAEPYSLAILLKQNFAAELVGWDVQILATDINQRFLARAAAGEFDDRALRATADDVKATWFRGSPGRWLLDPAARAWVSFQYHNLVEHPYPSIVHGLAALDLIVCRNVMIYFDWPVIERIVRQFRASLVDGGWLAVGHAEWHHDAFRTFRTVNAPGATVYQKTDLRDGGDDDDVRAHTERPRGSTILSSPAFATPSTAVVQAALAASEWVPPALPDVPPASAADSRPVPESARSVENRPVPLELARARRLGDEGRWEEAARACDRLLERDRLNAGAHFYRALIFEQTGDRTAAVEWLRRAVYLDRSFVLAHYHLGLLLDRTGDRPRAVQCLRNVQTLLARLPGAQPIADADGLTADDLTELTGMHLELWAS